MSGFDHVHPICMIDILVFVSELAVAGLKAALIVHLLVGVFSSFAYVSLCLCVLWNYASAHARLVTSVLLAWNHVQH